jgi:hypothetical protein
MKQTAPPGLSLGPQGIASLQLFGVLFADQLLLDRLKAKSGMFPSVIVCARVCTTLD